MDTKLNNLVGAIERATAVGNTPPRPKNPPYSTKLKPLPAPNRALIIYSGSGAWNAAKLNLGYTGYFVVLPFGNDPALYRWGFVSGSNALILGFGESEAIGTIAKLGGLLHLAGATLVVYSPERGPVTRIGAPVRRSA